MRIVIANKTPIELFKVLKFEGLADSGSLAKAMIDQGDVRVNDQVETRRRRKLHHGDRLSVQNTTLRIVEAGREDEDELC